MTTSDVAGLAPELKGAKEGQGEVPIASAGERFQSFDVEAFEVPGGREENWRFTPLRRLKGWSILADDVDAALTATGTQTVITDRRASAAMLNWYFHRRDITILIHDADNIPSNHFEANYPWRPQSGRQILMLSGTPDAPSLDSVEWVGTPELSEVVISDNHHRIIYLHHGRERPAS